MIVPDVAQAWLQSNSGSQAQFYTAGNLRSKFCKLLEQYPAEFREFVPARGCEPEFEFAARRTIPAADFAQALDEARSRS